MTLRAIVTDIEGTTTSLAFVRDVLYPFSRVRLRGWLARHADHAETQSWLRELGEADPAAALERFIDEDRKHPVLKAIQGRIWREGFERRELHAHVYADVAPALLAWKRSGLKLAVFSSGSAEAQQLLFRDAGLHALFDAFFDPTSCGAKTDPASYARIASTLHVAPADGLFLSDSEGELDAARAAGWDTAQVLREGVVRAPTHRGVASFDQLRPAEG